MRRSVNKILIIILIVIGILSVTGGVFAYLYLGTDMLRTGQELFAKYLTQNFEELRDTINFAEFSQIEEKLEQSKYEENITISYTEKNAVAPLGKITIDTQNDAVSKKYYGIISLEGEEGQEPLEIEYMKENALYALRFTNAVKQFISIENNDLKEFARNLGLDEETIEFIPDKISFDEISDIEKIKFTEEESNAEIQKYSELLYNSIGKEKYTKSKNSVITVNGKTITTDAYILKLNEKDIENILIKVMETLKQDEIILAKLQLIDDFVQKYDESAESIKDSFVDYLQNLLDEAKQAETEEIVQTETSEEEEQEEIIITVYEEKGKTVRIKLEKGLEHIIVDTTEAEGQKKIDFNYTSMDEYNTQTTKGISLIKEDNKLKMEVKNIDGEEQQYFETEFSFVQNGNNITIEVVMSDDEGQTTCTRSINILEEIEYDVTLSNSNNIVLNNLSVEQIETIFTLLGEKLETEYVEKMETLLAPMLLATDIQNSMDGLEQGMSEAEQAAFNSRFEVYTGENVKSAEVNALLSTVLQHNISEANNLTERYVIVTGDVSLSENATSITKVTENASYSVKCKTKNGLVSEIIITKNNVQE